jgi:hypothetical protein
MAYKSANDPDFIKDIQSRREYVSLMLDKETLDKPNLSHFDGITENNSDEEELRKVISELMVKTSNQLLIGNLMNPNTKIKRLLLKWSTGIGKTIGALLVAVSMEKLYNKIQEATGILVEKLPNIFVIGNTRERVIDDLLKFPEFGFVSSKEFERQQELNKQALIGGSQEIAIAKDHYIMLKRRVTNKQRGGFFRFFGYQELVNRIFGISKDDTSTSDLIALAYNGDKKIMNDNIKKLLADGKITLNKYLLDEFKNSLVIVDEFHNVYNSKQVNSWGSTLFYILDNVENIRSIFMTATPATNNVSEYITVMNFLTESNEMERLPKNATVTPDEIRKRMTGRVSFLQDSDIRAYPRRIFVGDDIAGIPYLKFIQCPMSKLQKQGFADFYKENKTDEDTDVDRDDYYIRDIAFPNPDSSGPPLYRAKETKNKISNASEEWKKQNNIDIKNGYFVGEFLDRENIGKYSSKYKHMIDRILKIKGNEKIVLFHNYVKMSGVYMLAEILKQNGYIDTDSAYADNTICAVCNKTYKNGYHEKIVKPDIKQTEEKDVTLDSSPIVSDYIVDDDIDTANIDYIETEDPNEEYISGKINPNKKHVFYPSRFGLVQGEQQQYVNNRVFKVFNDKANLYGIHMRVLIGAQMIKESVDLKAVRHFEILSMPINIPTLIQIIGRGIRRGSHDGLAIKDRECEIAIYIAVDSDDKYNLEITNYKNKVKDYIDIQEIEKYVHSYAVDAAIHRDIIMSADILEQYGPDLKNPKNILGPLYYIPAYNDISKYPSDTSYYAYNMQQQEIYILTLLIRRLFYLQPVWLFNDLVDKIHSSPFRTEINPKYMTEDNIIVALNELIVQMNKKENGLWAIAKYGEYYIKMPKIQKNIGSLLIAAPDSYVFGSGIKQIVKLNFNEIYNKDIVVSNEIIKFVEKIKQLQKLSKNERIKAYCDIIFDFDLNVIDTAAKILIEKQKNIVLLEFYTSLNLLIREKELPRDLYKSQSNDYIGYLSKNGPTIFIDGAWKKLNYTSAEIKKIDAVEQPPSIGYIEYTIDGRILFKIRKTIKETEKNIIENKITDARLFEKGAVCITRSKDELEGIIKILMRRNNEYVELNKNSVKEICEYMRQSLMLGDAFITGGRHRTFYWFHETVPFIDMDIIKHNK